MATKVAGCDPIIAVDIHDSRLKLARELGATHTINHTGRNDVVAELRTITGEGVRFSLETSAQPAVFRAAIEALMPAGTCVLLGSVRSGTEVTFDMAQFPQHPMSENGEFPVLLPRDTIADGANSAATCASAQGHQLGVANKEAATVSNGARAYSLAYE
jgi:threonine dehydrogenase-like Zn-dependent dehydrogenase